MGDAHHVEQGRRWSGPMSGCCPVPRAGEMRQGPVRQSALLLRRLPAARLFAGSGRSGDTQGGHATGHLLDFVTVQAKTCEAVLSVCTGAFVLHAAGLLSGRRATTHWGSLERLRALGDVEVVEERYVQDGNIWSSAGVSAGIDLMLAFIASVAGDEAAGKVQFARGILSVSHSIRSNESHVQAPAYLPVNGLSRL